MGKAAPEFIAIKPPRRQMDWPGHRVVASREINTGAMAIPNGRPGTIERVSGGIISVRFDACDCCGIAARLRWKRVQDPNLITFVEKGIA